ncbi:MAG: hypothetical protein SF066_02515 [Thermoanaerobaculia bacterium]|nr:hypothetical protein [Thermoanaerobaculia bacterium]
MPSSPEIPSAFWRRALLALVALGLLGTLAELLLIPHFEDNWQLAPLVISGLAVGGIAWHLGAPGRASARALAVLLLLLAACGVAGLWLHFAANLEFEREVARDVEGFALVWRALHGTAPPSLAPGALVYLALLGGLALWRYSVPHSTRSGGSS